MCIAGGFMADKARQRGIFMVAFCCCGLIGLFMLVGSSTPGVKYAGCFFFASGVFPNVPQGVTWNGNNIGGTTKRGVGIAMQVGAGSAGGIIASFIFLPKDSPDFIPGHCILIALVSMSALLSGYMTTYLRLENRRRDREYKDPKLYTMEDKAAERLKGDYATFFRYTV
jgi:hypothetical protein